MDECEDCSGKGKQDIDEAKVLLEKSRRQKQNYVREDQAKSREERSYVRNGRWLMLWGSLMTTHFGEFVQGKLNI